MKVGELIERLREYDPDLPAVVCGFDEEGFDDLETVAVVQLLPNPEYRAEAAISKYVEVEGTATGAQTPAEAVLLNF